MAAGAGRRMRPLTDVWPKPLLPIDGRPVISTLLRELAVAGLRRVTVVTGHLAQRLEGLVGDGSAFGAEIRFVRQPRVLGSADAVRRALDAGVAAPCLVAGADTVFSPNDVGRFVAAARAPGGAIAVRREPPPAPPERPAVLVRGGRVLRVLDDDVENPLAGAPLWVVGPAVADRLCLDLPPHELASAFQAAVDSGVEVAGVEIGRTRDLTRPVDLVIQNFPYLGER